MNNKMTLRQFDRWKRVFLTFPTNNCQLGQQLLLVNFCFFEMNSSPNRCFYPAQVYAQFASAERKVPSGRNEHETSNTSMKNCEHHMRTILPDMIEIFESGEVTLRPDLAKFLIVCSNTKVTFYSWISVNVFQFTKLNNLKSDCISQSNSRTELKKNTVPVYHQPRELHPHGPTYFLLPREPSTLHPGYKSCV